MSMPIQITFFNQRVKVMTTAWAPLCNHVCAQTWFSQFKCGVNERSDKNTSASIYEYIQRWRVSRIPTFLLTALGTQNKLFCTCLCSRATHKKVPACRQMGADLKYLWHGRADLHSRGGWVTFHTQLIRLENGGPYQVWCAWAAACTCWCVSADVQLSAWNRKDNSTPDCCQEFLSTAFNYKTIRESACSVLSSILAPLFIHVHEILLHHMIHFIIRPLV